MQVFLNTFGAVFTLFFIGIIGWWVVSRKVMQSSVFSVLSAISLEVALPAMIFSDVIRKFDINVYPNWWALPLWWLGFTLFLFILTMAFSVFSSKESISEFRISLFFQNGIFFPLAIFSTIPEYSHLVIDVFFFTMFYAALLFNTYYLFFPQATKKFDFKKVFHPVLISVLLAIFIVLAGLARFVPKPVITALSMVGAMSVPLLMLILGGNIYVDFSKKERVEKMETAKFVLIKNFLFPLITLIFIYFIRPPENVGLILLLESAVPPITATPILVERAGGNKSVANQFLLYSFILSLFSIPLMIMLFNLIIK
ncbi:MAG: AEC family transporter [bacterium]